MIITICLISILAFVSLIVYLMKNKDTYIEIFEIKFKSFSIKIKSKEKKHHSNQD